MFNYKVFRSTFGNSKTGPGIFIKGNIDTSVFVHSLRNENNFKFIKNDIYNQDSYSLQLNIDNRISTTKLNIQYILNDIIDINTPWQFHCAMNFLTTAYLDIINFTMTTEDNSKVVHVTVPKRNNSTIEFGGGFYHINNSNWTSLQVTTIPALSTNKWYDIDFIFKNKILYFYIDNKLIAFQSYASHIPSDIVKLRSITPYSDYYHANDSYMLDDIFFISGDNTTKVFKKYYLQNKMIPFIQTSDDNTFYNEYR